MAPGRLAPRLGRNGFTPTVVERAPTLRPGGQAVDLRGASRQVVRRMGLMPAVKDVLVPVKGYALIDSAGRHRVEMPVDAFGGEGLMSEIEVLRGDLSRVFYDATRDDVEYLFDDEITALDEEPDGVAVTFRGGTSRRFGLVVGADGLHSVVRRLAFGPESDYVNPLGGYLGAVALSDHPVRLSPLGHLNRADCGHDRVFPVVSWCSSWGSLHCAGLRRRRPAQCNSALHADPTGGGRTMAPLVAARAPGCDSARPTRIGGRIYGYPDNRAVNAIIGVDAKAGGVQVDRDGRPRSDPEADFCGGYSWCIRVNPDVGPEGSTDPSAVKLWGTGGEGCASARIDRVFIEIYPQVQHAPGQFRTDFTRYGAAAHYYQPITPGGNNQVLLRLPVRHEQGGNTGYVNGYITYQGGPVPDPEDNLVIRAFTHGRGPECGVEGFAASAERLGLSGSGRATYYRTPPLAGGRCGATSQRYSIKVTCRSVPGSSTMTRVTNITGGRGLRIDFAF